MIGGGETMGRLLLVEDDSAIVTLLEQLLTGEGYRLDLARDVQQGLHLTLVRDYDVVILDAELRAIGGLDLVTRLRSAGCTTPILVLCTPSPSDHVASLDAGADDSVAKPFDPAELLARVRAIRRRHLDQAHALPIRGSRRLDTETRQVVHNEMGDIVALSQRECDLLAVLARRPKRVFARELLLELAFPGAQSLVVVDTYVHYLRRKLGTSVITTVHGRGYQLGTI
ncbi:MAG TPA: response regulator transcription factor [Pseudonocardiaceae bacterium]|jgi:two-component system response regulator QseB